MTAPSHVPVALPAEVASRILAVADRDVIFILRVVGESQQALVEHFQRFIEDALGTCGVHYGDHPFLRMFVETHGRELADFVLNGIALRRRFRLDDVKAAGGMPTDLLHVDLWDDLRSLIEDAQRHFTDTAQGLPTIVAEVRAFQENGRKDDVEA